MPADNDLDPVDRWLNQPVWPMSPPDGTFEQVTRRARRRRVRKAVAGVASAAAVVAAIAVAVPLSLSSGLGSSPKPPAVAGSRETTPNQSGSQTPLGRGTHTKTPTPSASTAVPSPTTSPSSDITTPGYLPTNFQPSSVTWVSSTTGYIIGQAGTPGSCGAEQNSSNCTSLAVTNNAGQTWSGVNASDTSTGAAVTGVSGVRFLNSDDGWAYGPELWYTPNGSATTATWVKVDTGGQVVTDLETAGNRAYAVFASCPANLNWADIAYQCTSYTLKTSVAGSGTWTDVAGPPGSMTPNPADFGRAVLVLANGAGADGAGEGFLVTPQNGLYEGALDGGAWQKVTSLPCTPGQSYLNNGIERPLLLATAGLLANGQVRLALSCSHQNEPSGVNTVLWLSDDSGQTWDRQAQLGTDGSADIGVPASMSAVGNQSVILATSTGIYTVAISGGSAWQPATISGSEPASGFSYVGMTTFTQGVAIGDPAGTQIWMTTDGGATWAPRPITAG